MQSPTGSPGAPGLRHGSFERSCSYCGARFEVDLWGGREGNPPQEYGCPDCGKFYQAHAAVAPGVRLIARRTDGKTDRYQETMF